MDREERISKVGFRICSWSECQSETIDTEQSISV